MEGCRFLFDDVEGDDCGWNFLLLLLLRCCCLHFPDQIKFYIFQNIKNIKKFVFEVKNVGTDLSRLTALRIHLATTKTRLQRI